MHNTLLCSIMLFPYFMLVVCKGGSLLCAILQHCMFPLVWALGEQCRGASAGADIWVMAFVTFTGLTPKDMDLVVRVVLPKHYMEQLNTVVYDSLWLPAGRKVAVTSVPR